MRCTIPTSLKISILLIALPLWPVASAQKMKQSAPQDLQESPRDAWHLADQLVDALIKKVSPSVVQILVTSYGLLEESPGRMGGRVGEQRAIGSGFIVDS